MKTLWNKPQYCEWRETSQGDFKTSCSKTIQAIILIALDYNYCPYCGKKIKVVEK